MRIVTDLGAWCYTCQMPKKDPSLYLVPSLEAQSESERTSPETKQEHERLAPFISPLAERAVFAFDKVREMGGANRSTVLPLKKL